MIEVQEQNKKYQWIKGDNFGNIVEVKSVDSEFMNFTDGTKIFKAIQPEFLEEVIDGRMPLPGIAAAGANKSNAKQVEVNLPVPEVKEASIMGKMITKMSKKNVVSVPIQINLNIPTPALRVMLSEGMEEEDLNEEITEVALSQIELDKLQDYIKSNITTFLSEYYS